MMRTAEAYWSAGNPVIAGANNWIVTGAQNVPSQWTGTVFGTNPGFAAIATADYRPSSSASPLVNAATSSVTRSDTFAFPRPLFPPASHPPVRTAASAGDPRPVAGALDIGAFEFNDASVMRAGVSIRRVMPAGAGVSFDIRGRVITGGTRRGVTVSANSRYLNLAF